MKLWTWHGTDFSLTSGCVDLSRSPYYHMPKYRFAHAELARRVGTDQIIWCYVRRTKHEERERIERVLKVPKDRLLRIIDSPIWERIIDGAIPPDVREQWYCEARQRKLFFSDREKFIEKKEKEYSDQPPPKGGWWTKLFIDDITAEGAEVLLKHPIPDSWVAPH